MQRFVAELSALIEKADFEKSWLSDPSLNDKQPNVEFTFDHRRISAVINSDSSAPWPSVNFHRSFSAAIRRIDCACNIRWL
jgi:hypothetical protein